MAQPWAEVSRAARDRTSGAATIAARAAEAIVRLDPGRVPEALRLLISGHPEMAPLWRLGTDVLEGADPAEGARRFLVRLEEDQRAPEVLAPILPPWLLTISSSSSVLATVRLARVRLLSCMRSEPGGEGERMASEAAEGSLRTRVVEDEEAIRQVPAAAVLVGADAIAPGGLINKVKTRALAEAATRRGIPVYAVAGETKFLAVDLPVEQPFERVPLHLFTAIAAPDGLLDPDQAIGAASSAGLHAELLTLLG